MTDELWRGVREGCGTCEFYAGYPDPSTTGVCRRYPPQMLMTKQQEAGGMPWDEALPYRPTVIESDWCGEYKRRGTTT